MFEECEIIRDGVLIRCWPSEENMYESFRITKKVHTIGNSCFSINGLPYEDYALENWDEYYIKKLIIPATVKKIEECAIVETSCIKEIEIEDGCVAGKIIDGALFSFDEKMLICFPGLEKKEYFLPESTEIIGENAFYDCNLEKIVLNEGLKEIHDDAFSESLYLREIVVPNSVVSIGKRAFDYCPDLVVKTEKDSYAFNYCLTNKIKVQAV